MKKYYLVPVTTRNIKINGKTLFEMLEKVDKKLYERELKRINITYENPICKYYQESGLIEKFNNNTRILYNIRRVPEKLIIVEDDNRKYEFFSEENIECDNDLYLKTFRVSPMVIKKCIESYLYDKCVLKFIKKGSKKEKSFFKCKNSVKQNK